MIDNTKYLLVRDRLPALYLQHTRIFVENGNIKAEQDKETFSIQPNILCAIMLGEGTSITHSAVKLLSQYKTQIQWVSNNSLLTYACMPCLQLNADNVIRQARLSSDASLRSKVAHRMFQMRFNDNTQYPSLEGLRGAEGIKVKKEYNKIASQFGVKWEGRSYVVSDPSKSDLPNQLLTLANHYLYSACLSAILRLGYSPALGFIHNKSILSFALDIADIYKTEYAIIPAFKNTTMICHDHTKLLHTELSELYYSGGLLKIVEDGIESLIGESCSY